MSNNYISQANDKYERQLSTFTAIRGKATAVGAARKASDSLAVWDPSLGSNQDTLAPAGSNRRIEDIVNAFSRTQIGSLDYLSGPSFSVNYNVYGDISRDPVLGENTNSIGVDVHWSLYDVEVQTIPGELSQIVLHEDLVAVSRKGLTSRETIAKATGWSRQNLQNMPDDRVNDLANVISTACSGSNKIGRIVKGMMVYLQALSQGTLQLNIDALRPVSYNETAIAAEGRMVDCGYIFNSLPGFEPHEAMLAAMAGAFPPGNLVSHVHIPTDALNNAIVSRGTSRAGRLRVHLTPQLALSSVMRYAYDTDCVSDLHPALLIAASLTQNRYFSMATLPKVVSFVDLFAPAILKTDKGELRPQVSPEMMVSLGRLHQMISFATIKDLACAAEMSSSAKLSAQRRIREYLMRYGPTVRMMGSQLTGIPILGGTEQLDYIRRIDDNDVEEILGTSILEVLWLCTASRTVCENGVFYALKKGCNDLTKSGGSMAILREEMDQANVRHTNFRLPNGRFFVEGVNLGGPGTFKRRERKWKVVPIKHAHDCDTDMGRTNIKRRFNRKTPRRQRVSYVAVPAASRSDSYSLPESPSPRPSLHSDSQVFYSSSPPGVSTYNSDVVAGEKDCAVHAVQEPETTLSRITEVSEQPRSGLWSRVIAELTSEPEKPVPEYADDPSLMFTADDAKGFARSCGLGAGESRAEAVVKILRMRNELNHIPSEVWDVFGIELLNITGYRGDSEFFTKLFKDSGVVDAWWQGGTKAADLIADRGGLNITYEPVSQAGRALLRAVGLTEEGQNATSLRKRWAGNPAQLPRDRWAQVVNSPVMRTHISGLGPSEGETAWGGDMISTVTVWLSRNPDYPTRHISGLVPWIRDTSVNFFTGAICDIPPVLGGVEELEYIERSSSMTAREYDRADSRYLWLAAMRTPVRLVDQTSVNSLVKVFELTPELYDLLKGRGYFVGRKNDEKYGKHV